MRAGPGGHHLTVSAACGGAPDPSPTGGTSRDIFSFSLMPVGVGARTRETRFAIRTIFSTNRLTPYLGTGGKLAS